MGIIQIWNQSASTKSFVAYGGTDAVSAPLSVIRSSRAGDSHLLLDANVTPGQAEA